MKVFSKGFIIALLIISTVTTIVCASVVSTYVEENMVWNIQQGENY